MNIEYTKRDINYYELDFSFLSNNNLDTFFNALGHLSITRAKIRHQRFGDKYIFLHAVKNENNLISAKIRCIRLDVFPEIMNLNTDLVKAIESGERDGIVETTHIIIDFRKRKTVLAFEYNHYGAKINDLIKYLERVGISQEIVEKIGFLPIVNEDVARLKNRINRISEFNMKLHKNYIPQLQAMDGNIFQSASAATGHFENDYANVDLKIDYRKFKATPAIKNSVLNILNFLSSNPTKRYIFNYLKIRAEDEEKNNTLETFDLLMDKIYTTVRVQKKKKQKIIVSEDMFPKMIFEIDKLQINDR